MRKIDLIQLLIMICIITIIPIGSNCQIRIEVGSEERVFEYVKDHCAELDLPDVYAHPIRTKEGIMLASGNAPDNYFMFGRDFKSLKRSCFPVLRSGDKWPVDAFDHQEWISSVYSEDGIIIHALVHNEYHDPYSPKCKPGITDPSNPCWYNFISYAKSTDGGRTFTQPESPNHLVAMLPYKWDPDAAPRGAPPPHGYFEPSNIIKHNGYYYCMMFGLLSNTDMSKGGTCIMRTDDISSPGSWKIWDGKGFNIPLVNPYINPPQDSSKYLPAFVSHNTIRDLRGSLTWNGYLNKFMLVGGGVHPVDGVETCGFFFSLSDDLLDWSQPQLIREAILGWPPCNRQTPDQASRNIVQEAYPSLIDHDAPDISFTIVDSTAYLYFMQNMDNWKQGGWGLRRDLVRIPIKFIKDGETNDNSILLEPEDGRVYHGVQMMNFDNDKKLDGYLGALNDSTIQPAVRGFFFSIPGERGPANGLAGMKDFFKLADSLGFIPEISLFLVDKSGSTDSIIAVSNVHDWIIDSVITLTKNYGKSSFLRIGGEFNGAGPGWNGGGYHPYLYVTMFRKIVDMYKTKGWRDSVAVNWCYEPDAPNDFDSVDARGARWYPGDDYVDWFGLDVFDAVHFDQSMPDYTGRNITKKGKSERFLAMAREKKKPVFLSETSAKGVNISSDNQDGINDWNNWFAKFWEFIDVHPEIKGFAYINTLWPESAYPGWGDARIQNNAYVTQKYKDEMKKPKYIHLKSSPAQVILPEKVVLVSPEDESIIETNEIEFIWSESAPDVINYRIEVNENDFVWLSDSTLTDTTVILKNFEIGTEYSWRVQAKNENGWGEWSELWTFSTEDNTSVKDNTSYTEQLIISPNPASEYIELNLERWTPPSRWSPSGNEEIRIYNTFGECVITEVVIHELPLQMIDISLLPVGLYFIQIGNYSEKFIVVR